ncbi:MAG: leucine--tRNA ligase [Candidatus Micrarchaeaceae archaeon]
MATLNFGEIEKRWQKAWAEAKLFEAEPNDKKPFMVYAAFPYVNTPLHIGHLRTYGIADMLARYKRMRGYNVLFPMGFHATGTPVLAFAKRIKNNDQEIIDELKLFHIPDSEIAKMSDPEYIAAYFVKYDEENFMRAGLSIDFRRKFVSTEPFFSRFVAWQFGILNSKHLLVQGRHPVGWCPNENNPVGMHDTKHDVEPEIEEETAIAFKVEGENTYALCATYRPETVFGVTNIFVNRDSTYVLCSIQGSEKQYYISKDSAANLSYQMKIQVLKEISGKELIEKTCINPVTNSKIPIYNGYFVKPEIGTGIVMSVPAHAPFDYVALERLKREGIPVPEPIAVLRIDFDSAKSSKVSNAKPEPSALAETYLAILGLSANASEEEIEEATKLEYKEESRYGIMTVEGYEGMPEPEAREKVRSKLISDGNAIKIYSLSNAPVFCRCGAAIVVKVVDDQWFLNYGDEQWKQQVREHIKSMRLMPEESAAAFAYAVDWLNLRAVARTQGLGTRFPLDNRYIIESLSDSTIYPAFYTVSHMLRRVQESSLKPELFDFVFLGKGSADEVSKSTGVDYELLRKCSESFEYWYTNTSNHSAVELIPNHLTMYIFNHIAVFDEKYWPKQIVTNGMLLSEGEKMSKSLGNIVPLTDGAEEFGIDPLRMNLVAGTDLYSDANFSVATIRGIQERLSYLHETLLNSDALESGALKQIDYWLYSKLSRKISMATDAMERLEPREAYMHIFYNSILELRRYFARGGDNSIVVKEFIANVALMLQPVVPHIAEELWHLLGNQTFVSMEKWPEAKANLVNADIEELEDAIDTTLNDAKEVLALIAKKTGKAAKGMRIIIAEDWKRSLYNVLAQTNDKAKTLEAAKGSNVDSGTAEKYIEQISKKHEVLTPINISKADELAAFNDAKSYISNALGCEISIEAESESKSARASRALPLKPSLDVLQ